MPRWRLARTKPHICTILIDWESLHFCWDERVHYLGENYISGEHLQYEMKWKLSCNIIVFIFTFGFGLIWNLHFTAHVWLFFMRGLRGFLLLILFIPNLCFFPSVVSAWDSGEAELSGCVQLWPWAMVNSPMSVHRVNMGVHHWRYSGAASSSFELLTRHSWVCLTCAARLPAIQCLSKKLLYDDQLIVRCVLALRSSLCEGN